MFHLSLLSANVLIVWLSLTPERHKLLLIVIRTDFLGGYFCPGMICRMGGGALHTQQGAWFTSLRTTLSSPLFGVRAPWCKRAHNYDIIEGKYTTKGWERKKNLLTISYEGAALPALKTILQSEKPPVKLVIVCFIHVSPFHLTSAWLYHSESIE